jgi:hypothetical protein
MLEEMSVASTEPASETQIAAADKFLTSIRANLNFSNIFLILKNETVKVHPDAFLCAPRLHAFLHALQTIRPAFPFKLEELFVVGEEAPETGGTRQTRCIEPKFKQGAVEFLDALANSFSLAMNRLEDFKEFGRKFPKMADDPSLCPPTAWWITPTAFRLWNDSAATVFAESPVVTAAVYIYDAVQKRGGPLNISSLGAGGWNRGRIEAKSSMPDRIGLFDL